MNIIISGWPSSGTTSLSLLLAYGLGFQYLYVGGIFKHLAATYAGATSGEDYTKFEEEFSTQIDDYLEAYSKHKIETEDSLLLDSKITGFNVEALYVKEIMVVASQAVRAERAGTDNRLDAEATIKARDKNLQESWIQKYGIDLYSTEQLKQNYDLVLDNSNLTIAEELREIIATFELETTHTPEQLENLFWKQGKAFIRQQIYERGLTIKPETAVTEMLELTPDFKEVLQKMQQSKLSR